MLRGIAAGALFPGAGLAGAASRAKVIVVGGGFGGATCARALRRLNPQLEVTLIEKRASFFIGPFSNAAITGLVSLSSIQHDDSGLVQDGVKVLIDEVIGLDPTRLRLSTRHHGRLEAQRIVVSPGVAMRWDGIEGLNAETSAQMPHGWLGDSQVPALQERLAAVEDGGVVVIGAPGGAYRCPPGPYERASLIAAHLQASGRGRCKVIIADGKDDFTKRALFQLGWDWLYPNMIEWRPRSQGGEVVRVDSAANQVWLRGESQPIRCALASIVPPQTAASVATMADLADESGWCPVEPLGFESTRYPGIHVIGDAAIASPMPRSGFAANTQAKVCAAAIVARLQGQALHATEMGNVCYSLLKPDWGISITGRYAVVDGRLSALQVQESPLNGDDALRRQEAEAAHQWYAAITADAFGASA